jgi:hypothetical protein
MHQIPRILDDHTKRGIASQKQLAEQYCSEAERILNSKTIFRIRDLELLSKGFEDDIRCTMYPFWLPETTRSRYQNIRGQVESILWQAKKEGEYMDELFAATAPGALEPAFNELIYSYPREIELKFWRKLERLRRGHWPPQVNEGRKLTHKSKIHNDAAKEMERRGQLWRPFSRELEEDYTDDEIIEMMGEAEIE